MLQVRHPHLRFPVVGCYLPPPAHVDDLPDDKLLVNKANKQVIEPLSYRIDRVRSFLNSFKPDLEYDIVSIQDVYGPTAVDPDIQALVISKETLSGGAASPFIPPTT